LEPVPFLGVGIPPCDARESWNRFQQTGAFYHHQLQVVN